MHACMLLFVSSQNYPVNVITIIESIVCKVITFGDEDKTETGRERWQLTVWCPHLIQTQRIRLHTHVKRMICY